jgi:hypothetical protein
VEYTRRVGAILFTLCVVIVAVTLAQDATPPKYPPCPTATKTCNEDQGHDVHSSNTHDGCTKWCTNTPLKFTPDPIQACERQAVTGINVRVDARMESQGNAVTSSGGSVNWGDGKPEDPIPVLPGPITFNHNFTHTFDAAGTYYPSATAGIQFAYTGNGSCGYVCRTQQAVMAIVYLSNSPECATGVFKATPDSQKREAEELKKFKATIAAQKYYPLARP